MGPLRVPLRQHGVCALVPSSFEPGSSPTIFYGISELVPPLRKSHSDAMVNTLSNLPGVLERRAWNTQATDLSDASSYSPSVQTARINSIRARLAEFGIVAQLPRVTADPNKGVPEVARACLTSWKIRSRNADRSPSPAESLRDRFAPTGGPVIDC
jgi:hypothetical protein